MVVIEVAHKIAYNMYYNAMTVESRAHIVAKTTYKIVKVVANMAHNASHNYKFVQQIFVPF